MHQQQNGKRTLRTKSPEHRGSTLGLQATPITNKKRKKEKEKRKGKINKFLLMWLCPEKEEKIKNIGKIYGFKNTIV